MTTEIVTEYQRAREQAAIALRNKYMGYGYCTTSWGETPYKDYWLSLVDSILALPCIEIRAENQTLPRDICQDIIDEIGPTREDAGSYKRSQQDMIEADFVKVVKKEGK